MSPSSGGKGSWALLKLTLLLCSKGAGGGAERIAGGVKRLNTPPLRAPRGGADPRDWISEPSEAGGGRSALHAAGGAGSSRGAGGMNNAHSEIFPCCPTAAQVAAPVRWSPTEVERKKMQPERERHKRHSLEVHLTIC
ncbi:hypothetical protein AOLI_G00055140 [Acnodon oligacanthus]